MHTTSGSWRSISASITHTCGIKTDRWLFCWGNGDDGRLGIPGSTNMHQPQGEGTRSSDWASVTTGSNHTCATKTNGTLYCWGRNDHGQLGTTRSPLLPATIVRAAELKAPSTTTNTIVTLTLRTYDAHQPVEMLLDGDITDDFKGEWLPFDTERKVTLTPEIGPKNVSVRFRDGLGNVSEANAITITLK